MVEENKRALRRSFYLTNNTNHYIKNIHANKQRADLLDIFNNSDETQVEPEDYWGHFEILGNTLMKTSTYATQLKSIINSQVYSSVVYSLGSQLNDRKDRFDKADIIEQTVEAATDGRLVWVDDIGRDHRDIVENLDIEFKYMTDGMFTKRNNQKKIVKVKLKNSLGENKGTTIENPADFYMLGQQNAIAIISSEDVKPYLVGVSDGIEAHIPFDALEFIFRPEEISNTQLVEVNYKDEKRKAQRAVIESVKQSIENA